MKRTLFLASLLGVSMAVQASDATPEVEAVLEDATPEVAAPAPGAVPATIPVATPNQPAPDLPHQQSVAQLRSNFERPIVPADSVPPRNSEVDVKTAADRAPQPQPQPQQPAQTVNTTSNPSFVQVPPANASTPAGGTPPAATGCAGKEGLISNKFGLFLIAFGASAVAYKLYSIAMDAHSGVCKKIEGKLETNQIVPKKKSKEAKDALKNILEKGLCVGASLVGCYLMQQFLANHFPGNGFKLNEWLVGHVAHD